MSVDTFKRHGSGRCRPVARCASPARSSRPPVTTGASFEYLLATAKMESNFNPKAAASTSSARGLFQFIDQTWLGTVKEAGAQLGYGKYADAITKSSSGAYSVSDPAMRGADHEAARRSRCGVLDGGGADPVQQFQAYRQDRPPPDRQRTLYGAFHGRRRRRQADLECREQSERLGARLFPNAAAANRSIFYDRAGRARSVSEVYSVLTSRYASAANSQATRTALAAVGDAAPARMAFASTGAPQPAMTIDNAAYLSSFPDSRSVTPVKASAQAELKTASLPQQAPIFRSLFQAGERSQPVSPAVQELWGSSSSLTSTVAIASPIASLPSRAPEVRAPGRLDLFSDRDGTFSS